jgi:chromosomal replication initiator protein
MSEKELFEQLSYSFPGIQEEQMNIIYSVLTSKKKSIDEIIDLSCEFFNYPKEIILGCSKKREVVDVRHMTIAAVVEHRLSGSLKFIGFKFNRDHSSIIHARDKVKDLCDTDEGFRRIYGELNEYILGN